MLKIDFLVCEDVIAREMISKSRMPVEFANYLWNRYKQAYMELQHNLMCDKNLIDYGIISELKEQEFFKKILIEAKEIICATLKSNIIKLSVRMPSITYLPIPYHTK